VRNSSLIGAGATLASALIAAYVGIRLRKGTTPTSAPRPREPYLVTSARYQWHERSIMWALRGHLTAEAQKLLERTDPFDEMGYDSIESVLAEQDGVKINSAIFSPTFQPQFSPMQLIIQGNHEAPTVIRAMRAHILTREPPLSGTLIYGPPQGEEHVIDIAFDLDSPDPIARRVDELGIPVEPYFAKTFLTLRSGESMTFSIRAYTSKHYYEWEIEIEALIGGQDRILFVRDPERRPFHTTAFADSYDSVYSLNFEAARFIRMPPGFRVSLEG
jgi:hypothetical protein